MTWDVTDCSTLMPAVHVALATACGDPSKPLALPVLSTSGVFGATGRILVLRETDATASQLIHYADLRSSKFDDLRHDPRCCWCFYEPDERIQLRAFGVMEILASGSSTDDAWDRLSDFGRRHYLEPRSPGTALSSDSEPCSPLSDHAARENFAILRTHVEEWDLLVALPETFRRARLKRVDGVLVLRT